MSGNSCLLKTAPLGKSSKSGKKIEIMKLMKYLTKLNHSLEGITISGGEPFDQPQALKELLAAVAIEKPSWNNIIYSGYTLSEILSDKKKKAPVLEFVDILINGCYQQDIPSNHPLTGSGNQVIHYLTSRGLALKERIDSLPMDQANLGLGNSHHHLLIGILKPVVRKEIHKTLQIPEMR